MLELLWPTDELLDGYVAALRSGWSPDNVRGEAAAGEIMERIRIDPAGFVRMQIDRDATGGPIRLPDGVKVSRLPSYNRWLWDGEFCGVIGFRWQPGTTTLPPHCLGHIGFAVVPWKRRRGYAKEALRLFLGDVRTEGLEFVELTTDAWNIASQRVIEANQGRLVETFTKPVHYGGGEAFRYRIEL